MRFVAIVGAAGREIVEGACRHLDDVRLDERRALGGTLLAVLDAALPFQHRPAVETVLRQLGEDAAEIDLAVAERAEPAGAVHPGLEAAIHALLAGRVELRVLGVEHADARVVDVDEGEIVELLQHEMAWIVQDVAARMVAGPLEEHLERDAVVQILAGMDFVADVDARLVERVQDRLPARRQFVERGFDQAGRTLRPRIDVRPRQRAGERRVRGQPEIAARLRRQHASASTAHSCRAFGLPRTAGAAKPSKARS